MRMNSTVARPICTQAHLAMLLGVSQVTVCKSLANHSGISQEMRDKVHRLAKEHGYRPNASARAMREKRFGTVALVQSSEPSRSILVPQLLSGIQSALREDELHLLLTALPDDQLTNSNYIPKILGEWSCDGLLINYNAGIPERMVKLIAEYQIPAVWINSVQESHCVYPNDVEGGRVATEHLLKLGHRRIAYVDYAFGEKCPYPVHYSTHDRFKGYSQAMAAAGLQPRKIRSPGGPPPDPILGFTQSWMSGEDRPTAVVTYNDQTAKPIAMMAMALFGVEWPERLSLVTFDRRRMDELGIPLTTMVLPEFEMGAEAVRMLVMGIADRNAKLPAKRFGFSIAVGATTVELRE
jgi:LacI family transcriptional regulator